MAVIYLVEDDDNIRKLVCYALSKEGYEIKGFPDSTDFWTEFDKKAPSLVMLDIMLPGEDGLTILKKIRSRDENIPIVILSAKGSEFDKVTGLDLGADDYIAKPFGMTELISRVRAVLRRSGREEKVSEREYTVGKLYVNPGRHIVKVGDEDINLSFKEYSLLVTLLEAQGKVVKREELLSKVWGEFYGESRTLDVHVRSLRSKLGEAGKYIRTVKGIGHKIEEC